jgi:hypothetical protein
MYTTAGGVAMAGVSAPFWYALAWSTARYAVDAKITGRNRMVFLFHVKSRSTPE